MSPKIWTVCIVGSDEAFVFAFVIWAACYWDLHRKFAGVFLRVLNVCHDEHGRQQNSLPNGGKGIERDDPN